MCYGQFQTYFPTSLTYNFLWLFSNMRCPYDYIIFLRFLIWLCTDYFWSRKIWPCSSICTCLWWNYHSKFFKYMTHFFMNYLTGFKFTRMIFCTRFLPYCMYCVKHWYRYGTIHVWAVQWYDNFQNTLDTGTKLCLVLIVSKKHKHRSRMVCVVLFVNKQHKHRSCIVWFFNCFHYCNMDVNNKI